jgi:uncharacterized protein
MTFLLVSIGVIAGYAAGLLGIGGGILLVPVLTWLLPQAGYPAGTVVPAAIATSLASILLTGTGSALAHHRHGAVDWSLALQMLPGILIGASLGGPIAAQLGGQLLAAGFTLFLFFVAWRMALPVSTRTGQSPPVPTVSAPASARVWLPASGIGLVSGLVGIGGGTLSVPYLALRGLPMHRAVATSSALGVGIAVAGSLGYWTAAYFARPDVPSRALGYVDIPAWLIMGVTGYLAAPHGARMAHRLPVVQLRRAFAILLCILACWMGWQSLTGSV